MRTKAFLTIAALTAFIGFVACHSGPGARQMDFGTDAQVPGYGPGLESGATEEVSVEPDPSSLFYAFDTKVDAAIVIGSAHKELIKDVLEDGLDPAEWNKIKQLFTDWDIAELAAAVRDDVFGDEPLVFINFAAPLGATSATAFETYATTTLNWDTQTYDFDGDGQADENFYVVYNSSLTVTPSDIEKYIYQKTASGDRVNCLEGVDVSALVGCAYLRGKILENMLDFPSYDSSKTVAWGHLLKEETLTLRAKLLDDDEQESTLSWNLDEESSFGKNLFKKMFD